MTPEQRFLAELSLIERLIRWICKRYALVPEECEDFGSWAKLKLIENDYAIVGKFKGRAKFSTYLTTVLQRLCLDYRDSKWGKWRPSAAAQRLGPVAVQLDSLLTRDGHTLRDAIQILLTSFGVDETEESLQGLAAQLPARPRRRFEGEAELEQLEASDTAEHEAERQEVRRKARRVAGALSSALERISPEDRLILKLRFREGFQVVEVARALNLEAKSLYPRFERLKRRLRASLESDGITRSEVTEILDWDFDLDVSYDGDLEADQEEEESDPGPSYEGRRAGGER